MRHTNHTKPLGLLGKRKARQTGYGEGQIIEKKGVLKSSGLSSQKENCHTGTKAKNLFQRGTDPFVPAVLTGGETTAVVRP